MTLPTDRLMRRVAIATALAGVVACGNDATGPSYTARLVGQWASRATCPSLAVTITRADSAGTGVQGRYVEQCGDTVRSTGAVVGTFDPYAGRNWVTFVFVAVTPDSAVITHRYLGVAAAGDSLMGELDPPDYVQTRQDYVFRRAP